MGNKGDLSDFERGMVVGARRAGLNYRSTDMGFSITVRVSRWPICGSDFFWLIFRADILKFSPSCAC